MPIPPVVLPLNRPQYVPSSETLISALAWEVLEYENRSTPEGRKYQAVDAGGASGKGIETRPRGEALDQFAQGLEAAGFFHEVEGDVVPKAFLNSVAGVRPSRAKAQAASPMTPGLALLQDTTGMTGLANPVNYAAILETMFIMGAPRPDVNPGTLATLWLSAAQHRLKIDPVLRGIDDAFSSLYGGYQLRQPEPTGTGRGWSLSQVESLRGAFPQSPFGWLHDAWVKLTSEVWVDVLPPRVWVDWATTTLRMAMSFGFLWEAERHRALHRAVIGGAVNPLESESGNPELLPWPPSYLPPSSRSVRPAMRRRIDEGGRLRSLMAQWQADEEDSGGRWLNDEAFLDQAEATLTDSSRPSSLKNVYETVFYGLVRRDQSDHYGLLVPRGTNVTLLEPGTEWVAMVAGLAADGPKEATHVGRVVEELARLGLRPPVSELVHLLEAAGLARGSADADHGVRVASAFGDGE